MIEALLAKPCIENNEGMNHLLVKISPTTLFTFVKLDINLPYGVNRQINLNKI